MADAIVVATKRRRWPRRLGWAFLVLLVTLAAAYFVVTSPAFLTGVILPRVSTALNAKITVGEASISPFSKIDLHKVKVETTGPEPLFEADDVLLSYHLMDILGGNYHVEEATVTAPVIQIVKNADGTSNLDPFTQKQNGQPSKPTASKPAAAMRIDVRKLVLNNATFRTIQNDKDGGSTAAELSNINITVDDLKNGQAGKMSLAADLRLDQQVPAPGTNSLLQAKAAGAFTFTLSPDLKLTGINGGAQFTVQQAEGGMADMSGFAASFLADTSLNQNVAELHQVQITLTPTVRATNQLTLTGRLDMTDANAIQGDLKLAADSLDVTPLYNLFAGKPKSPEAGPARTTPQAATAGIEPAALHLPVGKLSLDVSIGRFYLREVAITNWQTTATMEGSHLLVKPCQLTLNGAPVNATADVNLGVPGYEYDLAFSADKVPVAPLADSFVPDQAGLAKGDLIASARIKGAGVTGTSLQKSLAGQISLTFTNADIHLTGPTKNIFSIIATALVLPELSESPVTWLNTEMGVTNGVINVGQLRAMSPAFAAGAQGTITMAGVLTNSTINNLPVNISLPPTLAQKARLALFNPGASGAYVDLGKIATVSGTIGNPRTKVDTVAIAMLTARALPLGGDAGKILRQVPNLGGLLSGQTPATTNQVSTNSTGGRNENLLQGLRGLLGPTPANTNQTSTNR